MEFNVRCKHCAFSEAWTTELARDAAAYHHLLEAHPTEFLDAFGAQYTDLPDLPRPETLGRRFADWERQG